MPGPKRTKCNDPESKMRKVVRRRSGIHTKSSTSLRSKKTKVGKGGSDAVSPVKRVAKQEGYCPFCQMPFSVLVVQSATWHISECLREPLDELQECPEGLQCDSTIQSHYHKFRHMALALMRSGVNITEGQQSGPTKVADYGVEARGSHPAGMLPEFPREPPHKPPDKLPHEPDVTQLHDLLGFRTDASFDLHEPESLCNPVDTPGSLTQDSTSEVKQMPTGSECKFLHSGQSKRIHKDSMVVCGKTEIDFAVSSDGNISDDVKWELSDLSDDASLEDGDDMVAEAGVSSVPTDVLYNDGVTTATTHDVNTWVPTDPMSSDLSQADITHCQSHLNNTHNSPVLEPPAPLHHGSESSVPNSSTQSRSHSVLKFSQSPLKPQSESRNQKSIHTFFKPLKSETAPLLLGVLESCVATHEVARKPSNCANSKYPPWKAPCVVGRIVRSGVGDSRTVDSAKASTWGYGNAGRAVKKCPFYKWIPGTAFTVDAFSYGVIPGCAAYFLSHFHADHYMGLRKSFMQPIYCSQVTANLVRKKIGVDMRYLHPLSLGTSLDLNGTKVTFIDANHCPGSVLILFQMQNDQTILHTGDFRANSAMERHLVGIQVNQLFLDTTYCDPSYAFPPQHEVITLAVRMATEYIQENPRGLIVVGAYTIGKERLFLAIAEAVDCHICVTSDKKAVLLCLDDTAITKRLTSKFKDAKLHVLPMSKLNYHGLCDYLESVKSVFESILAFQPTGWTHNKTNTALRDLKPKCRRPNLTLYGLPYSEHSSYSEMKRFVKFLAPTRIIPTVNNGNPTSRNKMEKIFHSWRTETREDPSSAGTKLTQSGLSNWLK